MTTTATQRALLIDGEWVETGDWIEVRSPYSGDVVARVAKGGADETRRALDAAERALEVILVQQYAFGLGGGHALSPSRPHWART